MFNLTFTQRLVAVILTTGMDDEFELPKSGSTSSRDTDDNGLMDFMNIETGILQDSKAVTVTLAVIQLLMHVALMYNNSSSFIVSLVSHFNYFTTKLYLLHQH